MDIIIKNREMLCTYNAFTLRISDLTQNIQASISYWDLMKSNVKISIIKGQEKLELFERSGLKVFLNGECPIKKVTFELATCGIVESFSIPLEMWVYISSVVQDKYNTSLYTDTENHAKSLDKALELYKKERANH